MQAYILQAKHNEDFYTCICREYADNFFDWKITITFYIAVHYLKALAASQGVKLPASHHAIEASVNPRKGNALKLTHNAWDWYFNLYLCSRTARYDGFAHDHDTYMIIKKTDYQSCDKYLNKFRNYMKGKSIIIP